MELQVHIDVASEQEVRECCDGHAGSQQSQPWVEIPFTVKELSSSPRGKSTAYVQTAGEAIRATKVSFRDTVT